MKERPGLKVDPLGRRVPESLPRLPSCVFTNEASPDLTDSIFTSFGSMGRPSDELNPEVSR